MRDKILVKPYPGPPFPFTIFLARNYSDLDAFSWGVFELNYLPLQLVSEAFNLAISVFKINIEGFREPWNIDFKVHRMPRLRLGRVVQA
ncbi:hypothetical protein NY78_4439 [Desulfovibrio sp. TomC]|nr:hypothetical protein NY78_4439 [Desulfovibrio sp. TomC]